MKRYTTNIHVPVQYPDDWDNYTDKKKLKWLKNRSYWHEYYELKHSLHERVKFKLVEGDNIYQEVVDSLVRNKGDKTEAEQLFSEYLKKKYVGKVLNDTTRMMVAMEVKELNDYVRHNYLSISQFSIPHGKLSINAILE